MGSGKQSWTRAVVVFAVTLTGTSPFAVFLFVMGTVVVEQVIYPTAALATATVSALLASWAANVFLGDQQRTEMSRVVVGNLLMSLPVGVAAVQLGRVIDRPTWVIALVIFYCSLTACILAMRMRVKAPATVPSGDGELTVTWMLGTAVGVGLVIFVASLFGLAGA